MSGEGLNASGAYATVNYNGLIGVNATDPYAITAESRSGAFSLSIGTQVLMCLLYGVLAFTAITSNMIVSYIVMSNSKMRTATNFFIVNLAVGDILMALLCIPFTFPANLIFQYWPFGLSLCVIVSYSQANSVFISAYTMVAISIDKYMAIMYPMRLRMPKTQAKLIILAIWSAALLTSLPTALLSRLAPDPNAAEELDRNQMGAISAEPKEQQQQQQRHEHPQQRKYFCQESWSFWPPGQYYYSMALMILQFVLPLFVLVITYSRIVIIVWGKRMPGEEDNARDARMARSKRKMIKMVMLCVIAFALTWLPFNALIVIGDIQPDIWAYENIMLIWFVTHYLAMCHTITNPLIYIWMNNRFRQGFRQVIGDLCWQARRLSAFVWFRCCWCGCLLKGPRERHRQQARRIRQQRSLARLPPASCTLTGHHNHSHNQQGHQQPTQTGPNITSNAQQAVNQPPPIVATSTSTTGTGSGEPRSGCSEKGPQNSIGAAQQQTQPQEPSAAGSGDKSGSPAPRCGQKKENDRRPKRRRHPHQIQIQMVVRGGGGNDATSGRKQNTETQEQANCVVELGPTSDHSSCTNSPATNTTSLSLTLQHHHHHHQHHNHQQNHQQQHRRQQQHHQRQHHQQRLSGSRQVSGRRGSRSVAGLESSGAPSRPTNPTLGHRDDTIDLESGDSRATDEDVCELEAFKSRSRSQSHSYAMQSQYHSKSNDNVSLDGCAQSSSERRVKSNGWLELLSDGDRSSSASGEAQTEDKSEDKSEEQGDRVDDELESEFGDEDEDENENGDDHRDDGHWPTGAQVFEMATLAPRCQQPEALQPTAAGLAETSSARLDNDRAEPDDNGRLRLLKRLFRSTQDDLFRRQPSPGRPRHHHSNGLTSSHHRQDRSLRRAMLLNNHLLTCSLRRIPTTPGDSCSAERDPPAGGQFFEAAPGCPGTNQSSAPSQRQTGATSSIFKATSRKLCDQVGLEPTLVSRLLVEDDESDEEERENDDDDDDDAQTVVRKSPTVYLINGASKRQAGG